MISLKLVQTEREVCNLWGRPISFTVYCRVQYHVQFRSRDKQVVLKPLLWYIRFRPRLLFMFASPSTAPIPMAARSGCGSVAALLLGLWLRIPPGACISLVKRSPTECGELFVINFIIFVLLRFSTNLSAVNHSIIRVRTKFPTVQKSPKFLLYIITLVSSAKSIGLIRNLFSEEGRLYILWIIKALELILVSVYPNQGKRFELHYVILFLLSVFCSLNRIWTNLQLFVECHRNVI
jgi:hypothetical protein